VDLRSGLRLLRERWKLILVVTLLAITASGAVTWRETPQYASSVTMFVSASGDASNSADAYQGSLLSQQKVKSYAELLRGHVVLAAAIERLGLPLTPHQLSAGVTSATVPDTSLLTVTVRDPSPVRAQQLARAVTAEFLALVPTLEGRAGGEPAVRVTVVNPAERPVSPVSPQPVRNLAVAGVLGLVAGFGLALARRALDNTVKTVDQTEETSGAPSLGSIEFDSDARRRPLTSAGSHSPRAEGFRKVRTSLQFADVDTPHQAVLVTSAMPGEGKSLTACNLAAALAEAEQRVILVDGDLRRPAAARYIGLPNGVGLTNVLFGQVRLADATQCGGGRFAVLTSGPIPPNPTTLLASQRMRSLLDELRAGYDTIIIDSPPALPVADAAALAAACDGIVIVVRHGKTRHEQLRAAVRALQSTGTPILGTVLNQTPHRRDGYDTYHYRGPDRRPTAGEPVHPMASAVTADRATG
jgi:capsular exopolysaccharide synthesis family protein